MPVAYFTRSSLGSQRGRNRSGKTLVRQHLNAVRRQGILSMELQCATGLARLWHAQGRTGQARKLLAPVYQRFTEGFGTRDLVAAKDLLATMPDER